jgi:hypothetical protein
MLQGFMRVLAAFSPNDLQVAEAIVRADYNLTRAADQLGIRTDAMRQRVTTIVRRLKEVVPGLALPNGASGHDVSFDQYDTVAWVVGVGEGRRGE